MPEFRLPEAFIQAITDVFGEDGAEWLTNLPALLDDCAQRWNLTLETHFRKRMRCGFSAAVASSNFCAPTQSGV
jgi:hypothetical protein